MKTAEKVVAVKRQYISRKGRMSSEFEIGICENDKTSKVFMKALNKYSVPYMALYPDMNQLLILRDNIDRIKKTTVKFSSNCPSCPT